MYVSVRGLKEKKWKPDKLDLLKKKNFEQMVKEFTRFTIVNILTSSDQSFHFFSFVGPSRPKKILTIKNTKSVGTFSHSGVLGMET